MIDPRKLRDYALNFEHATGRYKAAFFAQMGYAAINWQELMSKRYELLETIIVTINLPDHQVLAGDLGTIVEVYSKPEIAYDVEFVNPDGTTRALLTLATHQIRRLSAADVITTRQAALAG